MARSARFVVAGLLAAAVLVTTTAPTFDAEAGRPDAPPVRSVGIAGSPDLLFEVAPRLAEGATYLPGSSVLRLADGRLVSGTSHVLWRRFGRVHGEALPGTNDPQPEMAAALAEARAARTWLASGTVPGRTPVQRDVAERALLDLRLLVRPGGAVVAAWHPYWNYVWPRDASWVVAALAVTGHHREGLDILRFLSRVQRDDGTWEARYHLDGSGPVRDGRPRQLDSSGWVPWAVWMWARTQPDSRERRRAVTALWPMVARAAHAAAGSLDARGLPPAVPDYWETETHETTLGTAAPLSAGLRAATELARDLGERDAARRWGLAASRLDAAIREHFGPHGFPRTPRAGGGADAAVTFLAPPFAPPHPGVMSAVREAESRLRTPSGGLLPGERWRSDRQVAWTPETAFFALAAAASGDGARAERWLAWLADHRTSLGALPEKVTADGEPASVAPLAWTAAIVLLALHALDQPLPAPS